MVNELELVSSVITGKKLCIISTLHNFKNWKNLGEIISLQEKND